MDGRRIRLCIFDECLEYQSGPHDCLAQPTISQGHVSVKVIRTSETLIRPRRVHRLHSLVTIPPHPLLPHARRRLIHCPCILFHTLQTNIDAVSRAAQICPM